jgi:hypothetical protein
MLRRSLVVLASVVFTTLALGSTGCGTIIGYSGPQNVDITILDADRKPMTKNDKITLLMDGRPIGEGPGTYQMDPKFESHKFEVRTGDGRQGGGGATRTVMAGVVVADAFLLIFPIFIDYFDGGMYSWPTAITINVGRAPDVNPQPTDTITRPNGNPNPNTTNTVQMYKCPTCNEDRPVNSETCPHCGMK